MFSFERDGDGLVLLRQPPSPSVEYYNLSIDEWINWYELSKLLLGRVNFLLLYGLIYELPFVLGCQCSWEGSSKAS